MAIPPPRIPHGSTRRGERQMPAELSVPRRVGRVQARIAAPGSVYPGVLSELSYSALRASLGSTPAALRAGT
jgi:hypothetical protein